MTDDATPSASKPGTNHGQEPAEEAGARLASDLLERIAQRTAREMFNLARAAEAGWKGSVAAARDFELVWNGSPVAATDGTAASTGLIERL